MQPPDQHTAVKPANYVVHFDGSGLGPVELATSLPGQSPVPALFQLVANAGGAAGAAATEQVYIRPGFAPPVHDPVARFL